MRHQVRLAHVTGRHLFHWRARIMAKQKPKEPEAPKDPEPAGERRGHDRRPA